MVVLKAKIEFYEKVVIFLLKYLQEFSLKTANLSLCSKNFFTGTFKECSLSGKSFPEQLPMAASVVVMYLHLYDVNECSKIFSSANVERRGMILFCRITIIILYFL